MTDRPILFSGPMVRALLDGRKTQTRRVVKFDGLLDFEKGPDGVWQFRTAGGVTRVPCPYGVPGDRLWVKETWRPRDSLGPWDLDVRYAADGAERTIYDGEFGERDWTMPKAAARGNVSPLFMPRWASRLTLEITEIRVERLQDISEADARAEGFPIGGGYEPYEVPPIGSTTSWNSYGRASYFLYWSELHGPAAVDANPWVWAVSFSVHQKNVDALTQQVAA